MAREAVARRRRAIVGVVLGMLGLLGAEVALTSAVSRRGPRMRCHYVEVQYENAPEIPADGWTACEYR